MNIVLFLIILLLLTGMYAIATIRNLFRMVIALIVMEYAVVLLFAVMGYNSNSFFNKAQAIIMVILAAGLAVTMLLISLARRIFERSGTFDTDETRELRG